MTRQEDTFAKPVGFGVIGLGHWGPNYLRTLGAMPEARLVAAAEARPERREEMARLFPWLSFVDDYRSVLEDGRVEAVVVATPSSTHHEICLAAMAAGKDVLVEKPLALTAPECEDMADAAESSGRVLMVAHIFMYNPGILKIKEYVDNKELGRLYYMTSVRTNLGPIREDVNVVMDLAAHDVSIFNFIMGEGPVEVSASGQCIIREGREDTCFVTLRYPGDVLGTIHISWLTPIKQREILVVGSHRMIQWNDLNPLEPVRVHHAGEMKEPFYADYGAFQRMARVSDVHLPAVSHEEPLMLQNQHFIDCVRTRKTPISSGANGLEVVRVLEKIQQSLSQSK